MSFVKKTFAFSCGAAALGVPVKDTVKLTDNQRILQTLPREKMVAIRTPQVFRKQLYLQGCEAAKKNGADYTDDCQLLEAIGAEICIVYGRDSNIKVTTPSDLQIAEALLQENREDEREDNRRPTIRQQRPRINAETPEKVKTQQVIHHTERIRE